MVRSKKSKVKVTIEDYHKKLIYDFENQSRPSFVVKARMIGVTTLLSFYASWIAKSGKSVLYVTTSHDYGELFIKKCFLSCDSTNTLTTSRGGWPGEIMFVGGGKIKAVSSETLVHGERFDLIIVEEADFMSNLSKAISCLSPCLVGNGKLIVSSTPNSKNKKSFFREMVEKHRICLPYHVSRLGRKKSDGSRHPFANSESFWFYERTRYLPIEQIRTDFLARFPKLESDNVMKKCIECKGAGSHNLLTSKVDCKICDGSGTESIDIAYFRKKLFSAIRVPEPYLSKSTQEWESDAKTIRDTIVTGLNKKIKEISNKSSRSSILSELESEFHKIKCRLSDDGFPIDYRTSVRAKFGSDNMVDIHYSILDLNSESVYEDLSLDTGTTPTRIENKIITNNIEKNIVITTESGEGITIKADGSVDFSEGLNIDQASKIFYKEVAKWFRRDLWSKV